MSHEMLTRYLVQAHQRDLLAEAERERLMNEVHQEPPQRAKWLSWPWLTSLLTFFRPATGRRVPTARAVHSSRTHV